MAKIWIPPLMRPLTGGQQIVEAEGETVRELVAALEQRYPGVAQRIIDDGRIRPGLTVAVDGAVQSRGLRAAVAPDSEVHFVPAMTGGRSDGSCFQSPAIVA